MTAHDHRERVPGCYRCELGADENDRVSRIVVYDGKAGEWLVIERVERELGRFLCQQRAEEVAHPGRQPLAGDEPDRCSCGGLLRAGQAECSDCVEEHHLGRSQGSAKPDHTRHD